jgi:hypothetical protein
MTHLTPDEFIDLVDNALPAERREHVAACARCRQEAAQLRALLSEVRASDVPEPSPLFWDHFSARVQAAIGAEIVPRRVARWFEWPVLAPLGAIALVMLALVSAVPERTPNRTVLDATLATATGPADADGIANAEGQWAMMLDLVGDLDFEAAQDAGIATHPGSADRALLGLTVGEQQELIRLLREELRSGG